MDQSADTFYDRQLLIRALVDCRRISHFVVSLECFRQETPKCRRLGCITLVADHDELLDQDRHLGSVLARFLGPCLPVRFEFLPSKRIGHQSVACSPASRIDFLPLPAVKSGIGWDGGS